MSVRKHLMAAVAILVAVLALLLAAPVPSQAATITDGSCVTYTLTADGHDVAVEVAVTGLDDGSLESSDVIALVKAFKFSSGTSLDNYRIRFRIKDSSLVNGSSITITGTTASGRTVTFADDGTESISGTTYQKYVGRPSHGDTLVSVRITLSHSHDFRGSATRIAPTCDEPGYSVATCRHCGHQMVDALWSESFPNINPDQAPLGHDWDEGVVTAEPTCTDPGEMTYTCSRDSSHTRVEEIPAAGHDLVHHDAVEATCEEDGVEEYWECETCHLLFADEEGKSQIDAPATVAALGHDWGEWTVTIEPTAYVAGSRERVCTHDPSHVETEEIPALGESTYAFTVGEGQTWTQGSSDGLDFTVERDEDGEATFAHFTGVAIDGAELGAEDFEATPGSVNVSVKASALSKLSVGDHEIAITFDDGSVYGSFKVVAAPEEKPSDSGDSGSGVSGSAEKPDNPAAGESGAAGSGGAAAGTGGGPGGQPGTGAAGGTTAGSGAASGRSAAAATATGAATPKTGDETPDAPFAAAIALISLGAAGIIYSRRSKN